jgi:Holliday junction resolvase-like predicted endonuclease
MGENPSENGHYITVWAPRQCGKTWVMQQILFRLKKEAQFDVLKINLEILKEVEDATMVMGSIARAIGEGLGKNFTGIDTREKFQGMFKKEVLDKPLVLILDEFDALEENGINTVVSAFRNIYISRMDEVDKPMEQKSYRLHAVALIGVRSVLGIENPKGSPFNVQRSVHIPNLTFEEVKSMLQWYEKESRQTIDPNVIQKLYKETLGQPGLTCWFSELLTETYNEKKDQPITIEKFEEVYATAISLLPNANILNIISKAKKEEYKPLVLEIFQADKPIEFKFVDTQINFLYMNGIIEPEKVSRTEYYVRFANPFVQKQLFDYFSHEIFHYMGRLVEPFDTLEDAITEEHLNTVNIIRRYQTYLVKNKDWLLKDAPRRKDMRIFEAVYHFNMYMYLYQLLKSKGCKIFPQFPTGNGKIDIIIDYKNQVYGIELKSYTDYSGYKTALEQAARYGKQLRLKEILLVFFLEAINQETREKYEVQYLDEASDVKVIPIFVETGK